MSENPFENFDSILNNFDLFCNEFETRSAEQYMRGDSTNGNVVRKATEKLGGETPSVVREIRELGSEGNEIRESDNSIQAPEGE